MGCAAVAKKAEATAGEPVASLIPAMPLTRPRQPLVTKDEPATWSRSESCVYSFSWRLSRSVIAFGLFPVIWVLQLETL